jgi:hypothetical protein
MVPRFRNINVSIDTLRGRSAALAGHATTHFASACHTPGHGADAGKPTRGSLFAERRSFLEQQGNLLGQLHQLVSQIRINSGPGGNSHERYHDPLQSLVSLD